MLPGTKTTSRDSPPSRLTPSDAGTWFVVGETDRGTVSEPHLVRNIQQFINEFGGRVTPGTTLYDSLDAYFRLGGGKAYVSRVVGPTPVSATVRLSDGAVDTLTVTALSPGAWGNDLRVVIAAGGVGGTVTIAVEEDGVVVEGPSGDLADKAAVIAFVANSSYITVEDAGAGGDPRVATTALAGGDDDRANITDAEWLAALNRFTAGYGPGQVSAPGRTTGAGHLQLDNHANLFNRVSYCDGPDTGVVGTLVAAAAARRAGDDARYGGIFGPWAIVPGVAPGTTRTVPWSAVVAGQTARLAAQGMSPNIAPAGENGIAEYVIGLSQDAWTDAERETLNDAGFNVARLHRGAFRTYGFRTAVDPTVDDTWLELTNSRLYMLIAALGDAVAEKYVFAQLDGRRFKISEFNGELTAMLIPFYVAGSLYGETFDEAAVVDTGPQVNTEETIAARELKAIIAIRMSHFGEAVEIEISKVATTEAV